MVVIVSYLTPGAHATPDNGTSSTSDPTPAEIPVVSRRAGQTTSSQCYTSPSTPHNTAGTTTSAPSPKQAISSRMSTSLIPCSSGAGDQRVMLADDSSTVKRVWGRCSSDVRSFSSSRWSTFGCKAIVEEAKDSPNIRSLFPIFTLVLLCIR